MSISTTIPQSWKLPLFWAVVDGSQAGNLTQNQPALLVGIGDLVKQNTFLAVMYLPSFFRYDDHSQFNSDQHVVHVLGGATPTDKLTLRMSEDISIRENIVLAATSQER